MSQTLQLSDSLHQALIRQANRFGLTPEQMLERLLAADLADFLTPIDADEAILPAPDTTSALAAVERLTSLFADLKRPDLEALLADPILALATANLHDE